MMEKVVMRDAEVPIKKEKQLLLHEIYLGDRKREPVIPPD